MLHLVKKDIRLNRLMLLLFLLAGMFIIPVARAKEEATLFFALFAQVILCHMLFVMNRQSARAEKENRLLNALPLSRRDVVTGKYLFCYLCMLVNAVWMTFITMLKSLLGMPSLVPPLMQFMMMLAVGIIYFSFMLPISYISPTYATAFALLVYFAVIIIPSKLPEWLGTGKVHFSERIGAFALKLGGFVLPLIALLLILLSLGSLMVSQNAYKKAEF